MKTYSFPALAFAVFLFVAAKPSPAGHGVGDTVSDFKLKNFDGKMVALSDYRKEKGVILIFDCNTCPYSKAYNDRIIALTLNEVSAFANPYQTSDYIAIFFRKRYPQICAVIHNVI